MNGELLARLEILSSGIQSLKAEGFDVDCVPPQGAIYLSLRVSAVGKKTADGRVLATDEDVRTYLLREAGIALVPFQAFGLVEDTGWFRASVGAVSNPDHMNTSIGKAGRNRWLGKRPHNRGVAMNPIDHPHGGGEGRTSGGRHPVSPWGVPTKGKKTRSNKRTDKFIVSSRHARKK